MSLPTNVKEIQIINLIARRLGEPLSIGINPLSYPQGRANSRNPL